MQSKFNFRRTQVAALFVCVGIGLAGCGGESADTLLKSAKDYVAKKDYKAAVIQAKNALQKNPDSAEARYLLGKSLLESGDPVGAEVELRKARALQYSPDVVMPELARSLLLQNQFKKLVEEFGSVALGTPQAKADLATLLAAAQGGMGNSQDAEAAINVALAAAPDFGPALLAQARLKAVKGDLAGSMALVDTLLSKHADSFEGYKLKGDLLLAQNKRDEALAAYRKSVELNASFVVGHSVLVTTLLQAGRQDEAGKALEDMKKSAPKNPLTTYVTAQYAYERKDYKTARENIDQLLKLTQDNAAALQLAGAIEFQLNSFARAEDYFLKVRKAAPESLLAQRLLILTYIRSGQLAKAQAAVDQALEKFGNDANMLALAGDVYMQNGNVAKAEEAFSKASRLDPQDAAKKTSLALAHMAGGNVEGASSELEKIAAGDTKGTTADMALIASLLRRNELDKALKALDALDKKQPNNAAIANLRGRTLGAKRDNAGARAAFERALQLDPTYLPAATSLAGMDLLDKNPAQAKKRYEGVLAADPKNAAAMLASAELSVRTGGTPEEYVSWVNKAVAAKPTDPAARLALAGYYLRTREPAKALTAAQEGLAAIPDQPDLLDMLGRAQVANGDRSQAVNTYSKLAGLQPNSPLPQMRMAEVQVAAGQKEEAVQSLRRALQINPDYMEAQSGMVEVLLSMQRPEEALTTAVDLQRRKPKEPMGYLLEGNVRASRNDWPGAIAAYRNGLKQAPAQQTAMRLHAALLASGAKAEAGSFAQSWVKEHPRDVAFRVSLGDRASAVRDFTTAIAQYRTALEMQPNNPLILNNLAWSLGQIKDPKALEYAETANQLAPEQPALMDTLAGLLAEAGKIDRALALSERAVRLSPQDPGLKLTYANVLVKAGKKSEAKQQLQELEKLGDKFNQQASVKEMLGKL